MSTTELPWHAQAALHQTAKRIVQSPTFYMGDWFEVEDDNACGAPLCAAGHLVEDHNDGSVELVVVQGRWGDGATITPFLRGFAVSYPRAVSHLLGAEDNAVFREALSNLFDWVTQEDPKVVAGAMRFIASNPSAAARLLDDFFMDSPSQDHFFIEVSVFPWGGLVPKGCRMNAADVIDWSASL